MLDDLVHVESLVREDRPLALGERDENSSAVLHELRSPVSYVAEPLHHNALSFNTSAEPERRHVFSDVACFAKSVEDTKSGCLRPTANTAE